MDKFVQLPIVIPPSVGERLEGYVSDILSRKQGDASLEEGTPLGEAYRSVET